MLIVHYLNHDLDFRVTEVSVVRIGDVVFLHP